MKNLIILAFIAVSATMSHAASVTWTMTNVYGPDGNLNSGSAYIFGYQSDSGISSSMIASALQDAFKNSGLSGVGSILSGKYKWSPSSAGSYSDTSKSVDPVGDFGLAANQLYNFYAIIFDSDTLSSDSKFFVTKELLNKKIPEGSSNLLLAFGNQSAASQAAGAWQAIPEPTSGLMILLGMAGLALRRKGA